MTTRLPVISLVQCFQPTQRLPSASAKLCEFVSSAMLTSAQPAISDHNKLPLTRQNSVRTHGFRSGSGSGQTVADSPAVVADVNKHPLYLPHKTTWSQQSSSSGQTSNGESVHCSIDNIRTFKQITQETQVRSTTLP